MGVELHVAVAAEGVADVVHDVSEKWNQLGVIEVLVARVTHEGPARLREPAEVRLEPRAIGGG